MSRFYSGKGLLVVALALSLLQGCSDSDPVFHSAGKPVRLSHWNMLDLKDGQLVINSNTLRFKPASPLFTDYALKLRTMWVPGGTQAQLIDGEIEFPVGTILSKTFYYPTDNEGNFLLEADGEGSDSIDLDRHRLIETRLLIHRESQWDAFAYVWNDEQTEAFLRVAGASIPALLVADDGGSEFTYFVPNENQCSGCHTTIHPDGGMHPLGAVLSQLNHGIDISNAQQENQLAAMTSRGWLAAMSDQDPGTAWEDDSLPINDRAAAYLNIQCGHCHNPAGAADTSALLLNGFERAGLEMGVCKPPVAAGGGSGELQFGIVPGKPDDSILLFRMMSDNPAIMMPELGRSLVHTEGVALIRQWIEDMPGGCD